MHPKKKEIHTTMCIAFYFDLFKFRLFHIHLVVLMHNRNCLLTAETPVLIPKGGKELGCFCCCLCAA